MPRPRTRPRYRLIETTICKDIEGLSDDGKLIYFVIRSGPHTTAISGLWSISEDSTARLLGWKRQRVVNALAEVAGVGLIKHDPEAGVVFVPAVLSVDPPSTPDAVKGWRDAWLELPSSTLKHEAEGIFVKHCADRDRAHPPKVDKAGRPISFRDAFAQVVGGYTPGQEGGQEGGQEEGHQPGHGVPHGVPVDGRHSVPQGARLQEPGEQELQEAGERERARERFSKFSDAWKAAYGIEPDEPSPEHLRMVESFRNTHGEAAVNRAIENYFATDDEFVIKHQRPFSTFVKQIRSWSAPRRPKPAPPGRTGAAPRGKYDGLMRRISPPVNGTDHEELT